MESDRAVRAAAWLFAAAGLLTVVTADLPGTRDAGVLRTVGVAAVVVGVLVRVAPWERWPRTFTLGLVVPAFVLIAVGNRYGSDDPYSYATYFVVVFTWIGLSQPRRTSVVLAPVATVFYLLPLWHAGQAYPGAGTSALVAIPVCVLVGETVAWAVAELRIARRDADHRASLLRVVAGATTSITTLEWDRVLAGVVDAVASLGFEIAALAVFDDTRDSYTFLLERGLSPEYAERVHSGGEGVVGAVREQRRTLAADRTRPLDDALRARLDDTGLAAAIASPVWVQGHLSAVLVAGTRAAMRITAEDVEAFDLLAVHAGRALENAQRFGDERHAKELLAEVSLRDELTGIGNRRHAMRLVDNLGPGDAVMIVDLDCFKQVNDRHGHGTGDEVLVELADHLRSQVRDPHLVARYGGDEFIVVLPTIVGLALPIAERLLASWRDRNPMTTFSAGIAVHQTADTSTLTVANADAALYVAKRLGRDRVCEHGVFDAHQPAAAIVPAASQDTSRQH